MHTSQGSMLLDECVDSAAFDNTPQHTTCLGISMYICYSYIVQIASDRGVQTHTYFAILCCVLNLPGFNVFLPDHH